MNKHQEAWDKLESDFNLYNLAPEECELVNEIMDKETPVKPYINKVSMINTCSNCHEPIVFINNHIEPKRCIECGQVIDWSDEDE